VNGEQDTETVVRIAGDPSDAEWNTLLGGFVASENFVNAESIRLQFVSCDDVISVLFYVIHFRSRSLHLIFTLLNCGDLFQTAFLLWWTK